MLVWATEKKLHSFVFQLAVIKTSKQPNTQTQNWGSVETQGNKRQNPLPCSCLWLWLRDPNPQYNEIWKHFTNTKHRGSVHETPIPDVLDTPDPDRIRRERRVAKSSWRGSRERHSSARLPVPVSCRCRGNFPAGGRTAKTESCCLSHSLTFCLSENGKLKTPDVFISRKPSLFQS